MMSPRSGLKDVHRTALIAAIAASCLSGCSGPDAPAGAATAGEPAHSVLQRGPDGGGAHAVAGKVPVAPGGTPTIVILESRHSAPLPDPARVPYMDQVSRIFVPSILFVRAGHPVEFRNSDHELHNINVTNLEAREQIFNVAVPEDQVYVHRFEQTGLFDVSCDVHPGMSAQIVSTATPYAALADAAGAFEFPDVVAGSYLLIAYAGARTVEQPIEVGGARTEIDLSAGRRTD
jgi:hypothetical protein